MLLRSSFSFLSFTETINRRISKSFLLSSYQDRSFKTKKFDQKSFQLPPRRTDLKLDLENPHPNDEHVTFDEAQHVYFYDKKPLSISVTKLVEEFFNKFDPDSAATKMINGRNWPRPEYTQKDGTPFTAEQCKAKWESQGLYARNKGIDMHRNLELYLNDLEPELIPELELFYKFEEDNLIQDCIIPFRTEWSIAAPDLSLGGCVDFVGKYPDNTYCIMDWKRSKKLESSLTNSYQKAKGPLSSLDDCDGNKYFIQMNVYRYILKNYYGLEISKMILASFSEGMSNYFMIEVPVMEDLVEKMIKSYLSKKPVVTASPPSPTATSTRTKRSTEIPF